MHLWPHSQHPGPVTALTGTARPAGQNDRLGASVAHEDRTTAATAHRPGPEFSARAHPPCHAAFEDAQGPVTPDELAGCGPCVHQHPHRDGKASTPAHTHTRPASKHSTHTTQLQQQRAHIDILVYGFSATSCVEHPCADLFQPSFHNYPLTHPSFGLCHGVAARV